MTNNLIVIPPLTGAYADTIGPKVTLAYAYTLAVALDCTVFVPWSGGGRRPERAGQNGEVISSDIDRCLKTYRREGIWSNRFISCEESDLEFTELVISSRRSYQDVILFSEEEVNSRMHSVSFSSGSVGYRPPKNVSLAVTRERIGPSRWSHGESTLSQRFVAAHWLRFAIERFKPAMTYVVVGATVLDKWLLPSLMLRGDNRVSGYVHAAFESHKNAPGEYVLSDPSKAFCALASHDLKRAQPPSPVIWETVAKRQRKFYSLERLAQSHPSAMLSPSIVNSVSNLVVDGRVGQAFSAIDDAMGLIANSIRNGVQGTVPAEDVLRALAAYIRS